MKKVRMKVLRPFTRNLGGQIVHGNPDHPEEDGRILFVDESAALVLEDDGDAKRYSFKDEAREELEGEDAGDHEEDDDDTDTSGNGDVDGARTAGTGVEKSAQKAREKRVAAAKPATGRRRAKAPVGGTDTTASTNHPTTAANSDGTSSSTNAGLNDAPSDEAP